MKDINRLKEQINKYKDLKQKKIEGEIKELLKSFKIIIPEEEIKYCEVIILDEQPDYLYVQVRNHNDQTTYESYISNYAELLEETRNDFEFINVKKSDNCGNEEKDLYSRKNNNLIRKRLVFPSFLSNINIDFEYPDENYNHTSNKRLNLSFIKVISYEKYTEQPLLYRTSSSIKNKRQEETTFDHKTNVVLPGEYSTNENKEDKYWFKKDNNYVYGINNYEKNNFSAKYYGVFIERIDDELYYYMPIEMHYDDMDFLNNEQTKSVIAFDAIMDTDTHNLRIWKKNHELIINYEIGDIYTDEKSHESIKMLSKTEEQITIDDLNMINAYFLCYENNFVRTFLNDLKTYKEKLEIRDAKLKEESDIIDTRVLIDMNPKDIFDLVTNNKTECFQILIDEYNSMASDVDDIKPLKKKK